MNRPQHRIPTTETSHPDDPIPKEPAKVPQFEISPSINPRTQFGTSLSSEESGPWSEDTDLSTAPSTPQTDPMVGEVIDKLEDLPTAAVNFNGPPKSNKRRASTTLIAENTRDIRRLLGEGEAGTSVIQKFCCGGGCCMLQTSPAEEVESGYVPVARPDNAAFRALGLKLGQFTLETELTQTTELPEPFISVEQIPSSEPKHTSTVEQMPPAFVQPHPPYNVFSAPVYHARALTKAGAEKRTYHFDLDVTDYPIEMDGVDFKVGGAIGVCPPNDAEMVDDVFDALGVPKFVRDKPVLLKTTGGRWPTIWGEEKPRELVTTRRELLTWCTDIQSSPPTKTLLRLLAEHADAKNEKKILEYLCAAQGQAAFCDLRTGPHVTLGQLLHAFPSSRPPLPDLLSQCKQLMPRFYSLSNDPHVSSSREGLAGRRIIEMAVSVHETPDWRDGQRTGVGSGYLERMAKKFVAAESTCSDTKCVAGLQKTPRFYIPMFRGLMANPLSREFISDGPMMLIGAGVGMAPFRGFILNRLKNANCANKIWLVQGVRDASLDEIYSGELGDHEKDIKRVVQSRKRDRKMGEAKYVQDEVRHQADVVWFVINSLDGRVFVCGSSKGMGEGVESALIDVAMEKGGLSKQAAKEFWEKKKEGGQYIAETW